MKKTELEQLTNIKNKFKPCFRQNNKLDIFMI